MEKRKNLRLKGYDYSQSGGYFVTICTQDRECLFGKVIDEKMEINEAGKAIEDIWHRLPDRFPQIELAVCWQSHCEEPKATKQSHDL